MIFGNIKNLEEYPFLDEQIKACFQAGACAVTISDRQAAYTYRKEQQEG